MSKNKTESRHDRVLEALSTGPATTSEIADALGLDSVSASNAIGHLRRTGRVIPHDCVAKAHPNAHGGGSHTRSVWRYRVVADSAPRAPATRLPVFAPVSAAITAPRGRVAARVSAQIRKLLEPYAAGLADLDLSSIRARAA